MTSTRDHERARPWYRWTVPNTRTSGVCPEYKIRHRDVDTHKERIALAKERSQVKMSDASALGECRRSVTKQPPKRRRRLEFIRWQTLDHDRPARSNATISDASTQAIGCSSMRECCEHHGVCTAHRAPRRMRTPALRPCRRGSKSRSGRACPTTPQIPRRA